MSLKADDIAVSYAKQRQRKPRKPRDNAKKAEDLRAKVRSKMESMVKTREYLNLYSTLETHVEALAEAYGKAPKLSKKMSLDALKQLYTEIHEGKYGKL